MADTPSRRKTPEEIRAERIDRVSDPALKKDLEALVQERQAERGKLIEIQKQRYDRDVEDIRQQRLQSTNAPQPAPPGMKPKPYLDKVDDERLLSDAKAEVLTQYKGQLRGLEYRYNSQIDRKLDAYEKVHEHNQPDGRG